MVVVLEKTAYGVTILRGRTKEEWLVVPWWPCSGEANRVPLEVRHRRKINLLNPVNSAGLCNYSLPGSRKARVPSPKWFFLPCAET